MTDYTTDELIVEIEEYFSDDFCEVHRSPYFGEACALTKQELIDVIRLFERQSPGTRWTGWEVYTNQLVDPTGDQVFPD